MHTCRCCCTLAAQQLRVSAICLHHLQTASWGASSAWHGLPAPLTDRRSHALQDINLRELTKKYGRGIGLNINAVSKYAAQMLIALYHLSTCGVLHAGGPATHCLKLVLRKELGGKGWGQEITDGSLGSAMAKGSTFQRQQNLLCELSEG